MQLLQDAVALLVRHGEGDKQKKKDTIDGPHIKLFKCRLKFLICYIQICICMVWLTHLLSLRSLTSTMKKSVFMTLSPFSQKNHQKDMDFLR